MRSLPVAGDGVIGARRIARQPEAADGVVAVVETAAERDRVADARHRRRA